MEEESLSRTLVVASLHRLHLFPLRSWDGADLVILAVGS